MILAAEIKFRRYRASPNAPRLDGEYEALIAKTIDAANLLYWEPLTGANAQRLFPSEPGEKMDVDVDEDGKDGSDVTRDSEMGFRGENDDAGGCTARPLKGKGGARRPDIDWRSLLSGRGEQSCYSLNFIVFILYREIFLSIPMTLSCFMSWSPLTYVGCSFWPPHSLI